ncbi:Nup53p-like protein [Purpureocillium lavendulum]|uniref:Nup53p-like protein n=1 Tax=Purpureocillium lavendulum TaxID=1247861 RepID=A0AB34G6C3_9HYPO|nr:Nup53p-like protein [Purpureocillium lavendulum]
MAPLILHNVPDDECYVGDDGVKRPYAMIFNQCVAPGAVYGILFVAVFDELTQSGSFGKSTRRSRSRTGTPARGGPRENPTLAAADKLFGDWVSNQASTAATSSSTAQRKSSGGQQPSQQSQPNQDEDASNAAASGAQRVVKSHPVEMILRGYRSSTQQYAAIAHYEALAGTVLEDYPRDPPPSQRRYKSELRDPAFTRRRVLSAEERSMVNRADGGEHWVKVTFDSAEAGAAAAYASPQRVLGHLVYAEPYRGIPPARDEACPDVDGLEFEHERAQSMPAIATPRRKSAVGNGMPTMFKSRLLDLSPPDSRTSSQTMDTATMSPSHTSSATVTDNVTYPNLPLSTSSEPVQMDQDSIFCQRIPTARRARLLPAEQALLPQQSFVQRLAGAVPLLKWFSGTMIGNEVPRSETGDFDWGRASLYWKIIWWLDATFGLFGGDVCAVDKDE